MAVIVFIVRLFELDQVDLLLKMLKCFLNERK